MQYKRALLLEYVLADDLPRTCSAKSSRSSSACFFSRRLPGHSLWILQVKRTYFCASCIGLTKHIDAPVDNTFLRALPESAPVDTAWLRALPEGEPIDAAWLRSLPEGDLVDTTFLRALPEGSLIDTTFLRALPEGSLVDTTFLRALPEPEGELFDTAWLHSPAEDL